MKTSLAVAGCLVIAFVTGALINRSIEDNRRTALSHPGITPGGDGPAYAAMYSRPETGDVAPDEESVRHASDVFVPNLGQMPHDVYFQFIASRYAAHFRSTSINLVFAAQLGLEGEERSTVDVQFVGANRRPEVRATGLADRRLIYTKQVRDQTFRASVPLFSELTYTDLYDGVDLHVSSSGSSVMRRFAFKAGASTESLLLHYDGAGRPELLPTGALNVPTSSGTLSYAAPAAFQESEGERVGIPVRYKLARYGAFGFEVGPYDRSAPLMIEVGGI